MFNQLDSRKVFITGGTGYLGSRLIPKLLERDHLVRALIRGGSLKKLPDKCESIIGNALEPQSFQEQVPPADTFVHLVGVSRPNPLKAEQFRKVDLASVRAAVEAAVNTRIQRFIYVSVAHPAPIMKTYWQARAECEKIIRESGLNATILRPWYILGPGHWWPYALSPFYKIFEKLPATAETCKRLGLVKLEQMVKALLGAIENPCEGIRIWDVSKIRQVKDAETEIASSTSK